MDSVLTLKGRRPTAGVKHLWGDKGWHIGPSLISPRVLGKRWPPSHITLACAAFKGNPGISGSIIAVLVIEST